MTTPRTEAMAFRIWAYATAREWDCTHGEIAGALGLPLAQVRGVIAVKGWNQRLRNAKGRANDFIATIWHQLGNRSHDF